MTTIDDIKHGGSSGYVRWKCRCDECKAWKSATDRSYRERNAEALRASKRAYYYATIEDRRAYNAEYRSRIDRDAANKYQREWARKAYSNGRPRSQATKDRRRERDAERREEIRRSEAEYRARNASKRRNWQAARRARLNGADVRRITDSDWGSVLRQYRHSCAYCGSGGDLARDHVIPLARGGRHAIGNLVPACGPCNSSKNDRLLIEWRAIRRTF